MEVLKIKKFDVAIIGAGPVGLFATSFAHLHGLKTITFDSLNEVGGQPKLLYPFKKIFDIPAFEQITGAALIDQLQKAVDQQSVFLLNHRVTKIEKEQNLFLIDEQYLVKSVIIATGTGSFKPKKFPLKLNAEAAQRVHYFVNDPASFSKQVIGVFGGGDSALDWALELAAQKQTTVKLVHRRNEFRGLESTVQKLKNLKNVEIITPYLPKTVAIRNNQLEIGLKQIGSQDIVQEQFNQIVVAYGFQADNSIARDWGIDLVNQQIAVSAEMKTNVAGIYAIGDVVNYPGHVPVIGLGFGEAQIAVTSIIRNLFPEKVLTIHSTSI